MQQEQKSDIKTIKIIFLTVLYYITALTLSFFTSYFLNEKRWNFSYPIFIAGTQNFLHFIFAFIFTQELFTFSLINVPCFVSASIDIGISSYSLRYVTLAFFTMVKSSAPVFILLVGFVLGIEKPSIFLFLLMFTIGSGVFLTSFKDTKFDLAGFLMISTASFMAGFRWAFVQYLIEKRKIQKKCVISTIRDLCLPISVLLLFFSFYVEGIKQILVKEFCKQRVLFNTGYIVLSGLLSFTLLVSEFYLVENTSVIYLSMAGIVKELIVVCYSVVKREITLNLVNCIGLFVSISGIICFNLTRNKIKEV
ncbi:hypothetical protein TUBRATIS_005460 [Tubulinosema ratisbonensis]|uniref:Sugar phosphate transporter domain-containing protein n=1 Tax=Tubulinosema ratisbonensis TaxID=291195 RepID=A0A437AP85_9MICR|nr:hypothetical protein TUBRATIS_005460 [Tubulinosema ratisbonensis]